MSVDESERRVVIEGVKPEIDGGRFPIKRTLGEKIMVEADVFADGHGELSCLLKYRKDDDPQWTEAPMKALLNDRWQGEFTVTVLGHYRYTIEAWLDEFTSWRRDLAKRVEAGQDVSVDLLVGAEQVRSASQRASGPDATQLSTIASMLLGREQHAQKIVLALDEDLLQLMGKYPDRRLATTYSKELQVVVDPEKARFSAWYEMFPRSQAPAPGKHGTFQHCIERLPYIASMGFDVLYLAPIHPIGRSYRKGKNNTITAGPNDPGSPWAIGAAEGGHKNVHPQLGTLEDFRQLVTKAKEQGIEVALDLAYQCSPDHPYMKEHPEWFRRRPDGTVQYAENPPKKYQDIYPLDFQTDRRQELWEELLSVVLFWIEQGVRIFRVDNPHTKPFPFWEWLIGETKRKYPDVIFLSEAFTRPKVMYRLAKLGFSQSYTYFAWRNTPWELTQYFTELTRNEVSEYFRPNLWPNTPDILTEYLQYGGRPAFMARLALAATLGASYGIYGPAFELCEDQPREKGSEEYLNSEKYEVKHWDIWRPDSLREFIGRVNRIRRENPALASNRSLRFHHVDNEELICYSKQTEGQDNVIIVVVNLDAHHTQSGFVDLALDRPGLETDQPYQVHDLLTDARYLWHGSHNYVELDPHTAPAHIFRVRRRVHTEREFEYYL